MLALILVRSCDILEKSGDEVIHTCYMLLENIDESISIELLLLVKYLKATSPKISASGLFYINRKLLSSFFTVTTTYIIIILEFRNG